MNLTGKLLIAMPGMGDPRFDRTVIYLCQHGEDGAMGLVVNKPVLDVKLSDLMAQLEIDLGSFTGDRPIHMGGPVEGSRGFVLGGYAQVRLRGKRRRIQLFSSGRHQLSLSRYQSMVSSMPSSNWWAGW